MSTLPTTAMPRIEIEPEAKAYAEEKGGGEVFRHLLEAVPRLFPTFRGLRVALEPDPEIADYMFVVYHVSLPEEDYIVGLGNNWAWAGETHYKYLLRRADVQRC